MPFWVCPAAQARFAASSSLLGPTGPGAAAASMQKKTIRAGSFFAAAAIFPLATMPH
jgi:hypothetical protein